MPFCPRCREEYDEGSAECYDCGVPLVADLDAAGAEPSGGRAVLFGATAEPDQVREMEQVLTEFQVPFQKVEVGAAESSPDLPGLEKAGGGEAENPSPREVLAVPEQFADRAMHVLSHAAKAQGSCGSSCSDGDCDGSEISQSEFLSRPVMEIAREGEAALDRLIELVVRGSPALKKRAVLVLTCMGTLGEQTLFRLLSASVGEEQVVTANIIMSTLRGAEYSGPLWRDLIPLLRNESPVVRAKALEVIGHLGELEAMPEVIPLLSDVEPGVRDEADNTLCQLADDDLGFEATAPAEERERIVTAWKEWWDGKAGWRHG